MDVNLTASPQPPPSQFAMVAVFNGLSAFWLPLWVRYYELMGVRTFYLFSNGASSTIPALLASLEGVRAGGGGT
jgi:hypothetical protein